MNEVILIGRIGNKADISETKNGTKVATISLPLFHSYNPNDKETEWIQCEAYGKYANVLEMAQKGVLVSIRGELHNQRWQEESGNWRNRAFIKIDSFRFLEKKKTEDEMKDKTNEEALPGQGSGGVKSEASNGKSEQEVKNEPKKIESESKEMEVSTPTASDINDFLENL